MFPLIAPPAGAPPVGRSKYKSPYGFIEKASSKIGSFVANYIRNNPKMFALSVISLGVGIASFTLPGGSFTHMWHVSGELFSKSIANYYHAYPVASALRTIGLAITAVTTPITIYQTYTLIRYRLIPKIKEKLSKKNETPSPKKKE